MHILIGSDHFGFPLKEDVKAYLSQLGHEVEDAGTDAADHPVDYPDIAEAVALLVARGEYGRAILICGTGIGMAIAANKVPGVRAACCHDPYSAERARMSNDAQVLTMGAQIVAPSVGRAVLDAWLAAEFAGGRSLPKVNKLKAMDERYRLHRKSVA